MSTDSLARHIQSCVMKLVGVDDVAFSVELLESYVATSQALMETLRRGMREEEAPLVRHAAHSLKSSSAQLGIDALAGWCAEIEQSAVDGPPPQPEDVLAGLERHYGEALRSVRLVIAELHQTAA